MGRGRVAGSDWSEEDIAQVEKLWNEDKLSAGEISFKIPRTRNAILGMMSRCRDRFPKRTVPGRRPGGFPKGGTAKAKGLGWTPEMHRTAVEMWEDGDTAKEIGMAIGRSEASVRARASQMRDQFPARIKLRAPAGANLVRLTAPVHAPEPEPEEVPAAPASRMLPLWQRRDNQCAFPMWPTGEMPHADSPYCAADVSVHGRYCAFHRRMVYQPKVVLANSEKRRAA